MKSKANQKFWKLYLRLPDNVQRQAQKIYQLWTDDPYHPSLHFKRVDDKFPIYSVRVNDNYRVLGLLQDNILIWYWIGNHDEYERLLK
jgi:hypothetical protein